MNVVLGIGIPVLVLALLALAVRFVADRLAATVGIGPTHRFRFRLAAIVTAAAVAVVAGATSGHPVVGRLYWAGGVVFMLLLYLTLAFLLVRLVETAWPVRKAWSGTVALVAAAATTAAGVAQARSFRVREVEIAPPGLQARVTVMHLSDVHVGNHRGRDYLQRIVDSTNARAPDLVVITGDLLDAASAFAPGVLDPLVGFRAPVFYVGGNHEQEVDHGRAEQAVADRGVRVLRNEVVETHGLQLVGLRYMRPDPETLDLHPSNERATFKSVLPTLPVAADVPAVLLHHSPVGARYAAARGIDLMLAGHTHAGQVFPVTLIAALIFPVNRGLHVRDGLQIHVSPGTGTFLAPLRVGTSNEIDLLHLVPAVSR